MRSIEDTLAEIDDLIEEQQDFIEDADLTEPDDAPFLAVIDALKLLKIWILEL